jgi:hypothetical protein
MRSVLIATAGLALLAAPIAAQPQDDLEFKGSDRLTTCEVGGNVFTGTVTVADVQVLRGGFDPDIEIDNVEPLFQDGSEGINLCEALGEKELFRLCKKAVRQDKKANLNYFFFYAFKGVAEDTNPPAPDCSAPGDPGCVDFSATQFRMETFAGGHAGDGVNTCAELLRR